MKKITKSLMTLALLVLGGVSANAEERVIAEIDYSTEADREISKDSPAGSTVSVIDGLFTIENTSSDGNAWDLQPAILEGFNVKQGYSYRITVNYKSTTAGNINFTWGDWDGHTAASYGVAIAANDDFADFVQTYNNVGFTVTDNKAHVLWQCRGIIGTMYIKKVTVVEIVPDVPATPQAATTYGNLTEVINNDLENGDATGFVVKNKINNDSNDNDEAPHTPEGDEISVDPADASNHVVKVHSYGTGNAWSAQFWIEFPYDLPKGQKVKVTFKYKADKVATSSTQGHTTPGNYLDGGTGLYDWNSDNDKMVLHYTTEWQTYSEERTIGANGQQSIAINLADLREENNYYFDDLKLEVPEVNSAITVGITEAGWTTISHSDAFEVGEDVGYAAKFNGTSIDLIPVTKVPANAGVIIKGTEGTAKKLTFSIIESAESISDNDLQVSDGSVAGNGSIYVLANGDSGVGFYKLASGQSVPAGKAYLEITAGGREFIGFAGDATTVKAVETLKKSGIIYNLAGQQVKSAQKGIFIIDGKKIAIK